MSMQTTRATDSERVSRGITGDRAGTAHRVPEVQRARALDDDGIVEHDVAADELAEVADAAPEQHGHLADAELVDEAEVQRLLDDVGARDRDELVARDLLHGRDRLLDTAREGRSREPLRGVFGRWTVGHHHHRRPGRMVVAPAVGLVEQPTARDQRAAAQREVPQHRGARRVDRERHALLRARHDDVAAPVPVEELRRVVVGLGDEPVQRHAHVRQHLGHAPHDSPRAADSSLDDGPSDALGRRVVSRSGSSIDRSGYVGEQGGEGGHAMPKAIKGNAGRKPPEPTASHADIDEWFERQVPHLQPILRHLDESIRATIPGLHYAVKWKRPYYGLPELGWIIELAAYD